MCAARTPRAQARSGRSRAAGTQARGLAGVQWCGSCEGANPGRQMQRNEPSVLTQRALTQSWAAASASSHSLMSEEGGAYQERCSELGTQEPTSLAPEAPGAEGCGC